MKQHFFLTIRSLGTAHVLIVRLVEQEVGRQVLVLVAGKVRLHCLVLRETQPNQALNGVALLLGDGDLVGSGGQRCVVISSHLTKKAKELFGVLGDELSELGVAGAQLCENRLEHLRLLLDNLAQLLELGVVTKEVEVSKALLAARSSSRHGSRSRSTSTTSATGASPRSTALLSGEIEEVGAHVLVDTSGLGGSGLFTSRGRRLLKFCGDSLQVCISMDAPCTRPRFITTHSKEILHSALGVVESSPHCGIDLAALKSHRLEIRNGLGAFGGARGHGVGVAATLSRRRRPCRGRGAGGSGCRSGSLCRSSGGCGSRGRG